MDDPRACRASQLVARLQELIAEHGDLPICLDDPDTGSRLALGLIYAAADEDYPDRFEVQANYGWGDWGKPKGYIDPLSP